MARTDSKISTPAARGRSGPVRYELVDKDGRIQGAYSTGWAASMSAHQLWPDQEQDEDRTGKGWDIQVEGCDRPPQSWIEAKKEIDEGWPDR